ncbi:MAG: hydroxyacid dehydrogenase [Thaumarchaeota archaeon]|nr:hydroxyacid dehydrogenase [Nitrososphaerota archaeon]
MSKKRLIIVNSKSFGKFTNAVQELEKICDVSRIDVPKNIAGAELAEKLRGIHFVIATSHPNYDRDFFEKNSDVAAILVHGIGVDNVDIKAATDNGVVVTKVPGIAEREAVAELTIGLMISALRNIVQASNKVREGKWGERAKYVGMEIAGKVVGVIGAGNIGSRVIEILVKGFNARVLVYDPYISEEKVKSMGGELVSLDDLLRQSDIITIHCPLTKETYHLLNDEAFKKVKKGVVIVNAARGQLIDTQALIKALEGGVVAAAALDVVEGEPIDEDHPLLRYENVVITPHLGAYTLEALRGMDNALVNAVKDLLSGGIPEGIVNKEVFERSNLRIKQLLG